MKYLFILAIFCFSFETFSQEKDKDLPKANEDFASKNYSGAEAGYRVSSSNDSKKTVASYNLGNAIYSQKYAGEAKLAFAKAATKSKAFSEKHNAYHNMGNSLMLEKKYDEAMEAYKNALRNNPEDEETRYNFALAKKKDKENPNKDKDKKKEDNKDDKKEDKKDEPKKPDEKDKPKPEPSKASQQQLKNLLEAVNNEEKKVQAKVNKGKQKGEPVQTDKDW